MSHFGLVCPPVPGHVDPLAALGRALIRRGHHATFLHVADLEENVRSQGLGFAAIGADRFPPGTLPETVRKLAARRGLASLRFAVESAAAVAEAILDDLPGRAQALGIDALIVDQNEPAAAAVAEHLALPWASVCTSLPLNREPGIPPPFVGWPHRPGFLACFRNRLGYSVADRFIAPLQSTVNRRRLGWGLRPLGGPDDSFSRLAQLAQMPREFDFPRSHLPSSFRYFGPWFDDHFDHLPFPYDRLDGRPLVYGSLGTLQPGQSPYFRLMAEACGQLDVQLVLSLGKTDAGAGDELPGKPLVVAYLPQIEILSRAAAVITHSGMNTTQQALYFGVPLVAIPLTHDQPAIAARTARTGAGIVIRPSSLSAARLRSALEEVLPESSPYRAQARQMSLAAKNAGGADRAADLIEHVLTR